jgi:hypothetical protein
MERVGKVFGGSDDNINSYYQEFIFIEVLFRFLRSLFRLLGIILKT